MPEVEPVTLADLPLRNMEDSCLAGRKGEGGGLAVEDVLGDEAGIGHGLGDRGAARLPMLAHRARGEFEVAAAAFPGIGAVDHLDEADRRLGAAAAQLPY